MEHEPIWMDGVDVKNCKGIDLSLSPLIKCKSLKFKTSSGGIAGIWCSDHTNCYFKQLARKTQVIDEIEEVIKPYQEQIELDALSLPSAIESILERKTQECEELKGKYKNVLDLAKQNADANEYCLQELEQENYRYRKALEEIEKYCSNAQDPCQDNWTREKENFAKIILDIIRREKGEE